MHPAQIKAALTIAGYRQTEVAQELGIAPTTVGAVINGRSRSKLVEERISAMTGLSLAELWPQWHGDGELVLTDQERQLVVDFRQLTLGQREQLLAFIVATRAGVVGSAAVIATHGGIAAGRDQHIDLKGPRGRSKK